MCVSPPLGRATQKCKKNYRNLIEILRNLSFPMPEHNAKTVFWPLAYVPHASGAFPRGFHRLSWKSWEILILSENPMAEPGNGLQRLAAAAEP